MKNKSNQIKRNATPKCSEMVQKAKITKWIAEQPITKRLSLQADGSIHKISTADKLYSGQVRQLDCTPDEFIKIIETIQPNECLSYGVPINLNATDFTTKAALTSEVESNTIARIKEAMQWPFGPGIMMIDYDPTDKVLSPEELLEALYQCCTDIRNVAHVWNASTSSCLFNKSTNQQVRGIEGQRVYIFVSNASDIPRAAKVLAKRAWLNGFGHIKISKNGGLLTRSIVDEAVFRTNTIDYCAPAVCEPPLRQKKPKAKLHGNRLLALNTAVALPELISTEQENYEKLVSSSKFALNHKAHTVRNQYMADEVKKLVERGIEPSMAENSISNAINRRILSPDFLLLSEDGLEVTVGEILDNKTYWHEKCFADPVEPDYHDDHRIAKAFLVGPGRPIIHSFAHGSHVYELTPKTETIRLEPGNRQNYMSVISKHLKQHDELFKRADQLVSIDSECKLVQQNDQQILSIFDRCFRFEKWNEKKKAWTVTDAHINLAKQFAGAFSSHFWAINGILTAPIIDPENNRVIETTGYDQSNGVYAYMPEIKFPVVLKPSIEEVEQAVKDLWWCVHKFPFSKPIDQTVMFTAMLTAIERPLLKTSPGFAFDAPVQASGKSLLTKVLSELSGTAPVMSPHPGSQNENELRKSIFSLLLEGRRVIVFDNVIGLIDSPSLAAVFTSTSYSDRVLSKSKTATVPTNALILMSGNNIRLKGDLTRRILKCRIDPKSEKPHQRSFDFDPAEVVRTQRQKLVAAGLTIINGYLNSGTVVTTESGKFASFETWDSIIRKTVCWLAELQKNALLPSGEVSNDFYPQLEDPINSVAEALAEDPTLLQLGRLLECWHNMFGCGIDKKITTKELIAKAESATGFGEINKTIDFSLRDVLEEVAGLKFGLQINSQKLGTYLSSNIDKVFGGLVLRQDEPYQNAATWWLDVG